MTASIDNAARSIPGPPPDPHAWMPDLDGSAAPLPVDDAADPTSADATLEPERAGSAANALLAGPGADGFSGARRLTGAAGATLVVDPERDAYYFESSRLQPLADLLSQPADSWTPVYSKSLAETRETSAAQPLERLRWFAGLVASPGVLDPALDRQARFQLVHWATIEREFPRHFRIARQFLGHAATVDAAAALAGVPVAEVIDYVNAGTMSGRLRVAE